MTTRCASGSCTGKITTSDRLLSAYLADLDHRRLGWRKDDAGNWWCPRCWREVAQ